MRRWAFLAPAALFAALAVVFGVYLFEIGSGQKDVRAVPSPLIDKPAPEFSLRGLDGNGPGLARVDLLGQVSLVNVFASWCLPCKAEVPVLLELARRGVTVYGLDVKDKPDDAREFLDRYGNPYARIGADRTGRTAIDWGVYGYPETFLIDAAGRIRYKHIGPIMPYELEEVILPLVRKFSR